MKTIIGPPVPKKIPKELTAFNDKRIDNYYWLNERENPEVISYLEAENNYLENDLEHLEPLRQELYEEMKGRMKPDDVSVPFFKNEYWYYSRYEDGKEHPIYCRKKRTMAHEEEILFNVNELAAGQEYYSLQEFEISDDNKLAAFISDNMGRKEFVLQIKDLKSGEVYPERLFPTDDTMAWAADNKTIFYVIKDEETLRPYKVMRHAAGEDQNKDEVIYEESDEAFEVGVEASRSGKLIIITSVSTLTSEQRVLEADDPKGEFKVVQSRVRGLEYYVDELNGELYILTNLNAKNFRVMKADLKNPEKENWKEILPHRTDFLMEHIELFEDYLIIEGHKDGLKQLNVMSWDTLEDNFIEFGEPPYTLDLEENPEADTELLRFVYSSMKVPDKYFELNMKTGEKKVLKQEVIIGFNESDYVTERVFAIARDGTKIPISLAYKKGMRKDGSHPLHMEGYGAYGDSYDPLFIPERLALLDRGFIAAIAHLRGGQEFGREWYEKGKLLLKKNTFYDFIDCAEYLIAEKFTSKGKLSIEGMSAGGLLIGAVINMRPDLWNAVLADAAFLDVITTMQDEDLPLTTGEYDEWGNPADPEHYSYMRSYSPYDNIEEKKYPAILASASFPDSQVQYWEPAKWTAKLRDHNKSGNPIYLHTEMHASHFGKSGRYEALKMRALQFAFILDRMSKSK